MPPPMRLYALRGATSVTVNDRSAILAATDEHDAEDQLRAFVDELHGFLATDESGSLTSLLAWLDHAERLDEFAPRTEPPEDDVVQLLTIHGSKGLQFPVVYLPFVSDLYPRTPQVPLFHDEQGRRCLDVSGPDSPHAGVAVAEEAGEDS